ncbi:MAG: helix-hairpin-helix domain-containing protein [Planctomycetaceae bacterium]|nr:helix-hairpin-helix domain-containing protein [Planctomycetaceae bacterium]
MPNPPHPPRWVLRRADQATVAVLVVLALLAMIGWWTARGGWRGALIEIDESPALTARFEVDVNTADLPELMQLPGVGEKLAERIIEARDSAGPFLSPDDLRRVHGIGPKTFEKLRPYLRPIGKEETRASH